MEYLVSYTMAKLVPLHKPERRAWLNMIHASRHEKITTRLISEIKTSLLVVHNGNVCINNIIKLEE